MFFFLSCFNLSERPLSKFASLRYGVFAFWPVCVGVAKDFSYSATLFARNGDLDMQDFEWTPRTISQQMIDNLGDLFATLMLS